MQHYGVSSSSSESSTDNNSQISSDQHTVAPDDIVNANWFVQRLHWLSFKYLGLVFACACAIQIAGV